MVNSEELIGTTEYLTLYTKCRIKRCHYNRVQLYYYSFIRMYNSKSALILATRVVLRLLTDYKQTVGEKCGHNLYKFLL
jgi:hypothetical protein